MNHGYFPDDSSPKDLFSMKAFDTPSIVQFVHRNVAYFIFFYLVLLQLLYIETTILFI